jgi:hypothetical protein
MEETKSRIIIISCNPYKCLIGDYPLLGGGVKKFDDNWHHVNIKLIDGNGIKVACKGVLKLMVFKLQNSNQADSKTFHTSGRKSENH